MQNLMLKQIFRARLTTFWYSCISMCIAVPADIFSDNGEMVHLQVKQPGKFDLMLHTLAVTIFAWLWPVSVSTVSPSLHTDAAWAVDDTTRPSPHVAGVHQPHAFFACGSLDSGKHITNTVCGSIISPCHHSCHIWMPKSTLLSEVVGEVSLFTQNYLSISLEQCLCRGKELLDLGRQGKDERTEAAEESSEESRIPH